MATQSQTQTQRGGWGIRRSHVGFALAFGVGAALLPPDGAVTIAGWFGGAIGAVVAGLLVAGVVVGALRVAEDWRPTHVADPEIPDSGTRHAVFAAVVLQLFAVGLGSTAGLSTEGMLYFAGPVNLLVAVAVALDITALDKRGVEWDTVAYGYAAGAVVLGFVAGLAYWRARGRKRAELAPPAGGPPGQGGQGQPPAGGSQQGGRPPRGGGQPPQGGQGQPPQQGRGQPQQRQGQPPQQGQRQPPQQGGRGPEQGGQTDSGRSRGGQGATGGGTGGADRDADTAGESPDAADDPATDGTATDEPAPGADDEPRREGNDDA